jgi:hypothetical protein
MALPSTFEKSPLAALLPAVAAAGDALEMEVTGTIGGIIGFRA